MFALRKRTKAPQLLQVNAKRTWREQNCNRRNKTLPAGEEEAKMGNKCLKHKSKSYRTGYESFDFARETES